MDQTKAQNNVIVIGNLDGVHIGHQVLLKAGRAVADARGVPLTVLTFDPHPRVYFRPDTPPFLLTPDGLKGDLLRAYGADQVVTIPFDTHLAEMMPQVFMDDVLRGQLKATHVVVGSDFHFGHNRAGNIATLIQGNFIVTSVPLYTDHAGIAFSSTRIRATIQDGHIGDANAMLGWEWEIRGVVAHGDKRGRTLGYPTLNIDLGATICPAHGIYAARVQVGGDETWYGSAVSLGTRPMFAVEKPLLEAHLFEFDRDVYGAPVRVHLVQKLRDEAKFGTLDDLVAQMKKDCDSARKLLELGS